MNAKQKESVLYTNGYCHNFDVTGYSSVKLHMWSIGDYIVSENESKAVATHAAYEHYLASEKEQVASETAQASYDSNGTFLDDIQAAKAEIEALRKPFPKFAVGQLVEAYGHRGKITQIRQLAQMNDGSPNEYTFEDSFPSNAWFAEVELIPVYDDMATESLRNQIDELRKALEAERVKNAALEAWKNGALVDFKTIADKAKRIYNGDLDMQTAQALANGIYTLSRLEEALQVPADEAAKPKFMVDDKVIVAGERDKGIRTINSVHNSPHGKYEYGIILESGKMSDILWHEAQLELHYRPSWNLNKIAKENS